MVGIRASRTAARRQPEKGKVVDIVHRGGWRAHAMRAYRAKASREGSGERAVVKKKKESLRTAARRQSEKGKVVDTAPQCAAWWPPKGPRSRFLIT